jgi:hypothetical protein
MVRAGPSTGPVSAGGRLTRHAARIPPARPAQHSERRPRRSRRGGRGTGTAPPPTSGRMAPGPAMAMQSGDPEPPSGPSGGPADRTCEHVTVNVVLGDPAGKVAAPALPHRLCPGARRPALQWRYSLAIRPPRSPSGDPAARNVRHSQWPTGPRPAHGPGGTVPGPRRRPGSVAEAGSPPGSRSPGRGTATEPLRRPSDGDGGAPRPGPLRRPGAVAVVSRPGRHWAEHAGGTARPQGGRGRWRRWRSRSMA